MRTVLTSPIKEYSRRPDLLSGWLRGRESRVVHPLGVEGNPAEDMLAILRGNTVYHWWTQHRDVAVGAVGRTDRSLSPRVDLPADWQSRVANKIVNTKLPAEKRLRGDLAGLRQGLRRGECKMKWVPDGSMMADPLTKGDVYITPFERLKLKKNLLMSLKHSNTIIKSVTTGTVQREDASRYWGHWIQFDVAILSVDGARRHFMDFGGIASGLRRDDVR
jgi:hypothetical protein